MKRAAILGPIVAIVVSLGVVFMSTRNNREPEAPATAPATTPAPPVVRKAEPPRPAPAAEPATPKAVAPKKAAPAAASTRTASGSVPVAGLTARVAKASRIYVEGKHDAELVEKVWGHDLRVEGVVVEQLDGVDVLPDAIAAFRPGPSRRLGVLVDHLVPGSKEARIAAAVRSPQPRPCRCNHCRYREPIHCRLLVASRWTARSCRTQARARSTR